MYITTNQPDIKSYTNPNTNPNPNPSTKQHTIVSIQLNIATCPKLRLRNDLYCVGWGVKLYSLTCPKYPEKCIYTRQYYCTVSTTFRCHCHFAYRDSNPNPNPNPNPGRCGVGRSAGSTHFPHPSSLPLPPFPYLSPFQIILLET